MGDSPFGAGGGGLGVSTPWLGSSPSSEAKTWKPVQHATKQNIVFLSHEPFEGGLNQCSYSGNHDTCSFESGCKFEPGLKSLSRKGKRHTAGKATVLLVLDTTDAFLCPHLPLAQQGMHQGLHLIASQLPWLGTLELCPLVRTCHRGTLVLKDRGQGSHI